MALSDPQGILASPLQVIDGTKRGAAMDIITDLARQHGVELVVIGQPRSLDGTLGTEAQKARAFGDALARHSGLSVEPWDERLSTMMANRLMREAGLKKTKMKQRRDAVAAAVILQSYLDSQRARGGGD